MRVEPLTVRFDVTEALPYEITQGQPQWIMAHVFAPPEPQPGCTSVLTCLHGGTYDWRYFHITPRGLAGYSMAEYLAARGHLVIVPDQLGVGESSRPAAPRKATRHIVATANQAAMAQAYAMLQAGKLHPALPPSPTLLKVGIGHSMGAMVLVTEQAKFAPYDLVAPIGYTNHGAHLDIGGKTVSVASPFDDSWPDYRRTNRERVMRTFHLDDLPAEVLAADQEIWVEYLSVLAWESQHSSTVEESASIRTPVFLALGERDVSPDPITEAAFFCGSSDVTLFRLERSAHCHNFAETRRRLWSRLDRWITSLKGALD